MEVCSKTGNIQRFTVAILRNHDCGSIKHLTQAFSSLHHMPVHIMSLPSPPAEAWRGFERATACEITWMENQWTQFIWEEGVESRVITVAADSLPHQLIRILLYTI